MNDSVPAERVPPQQSSRHGVLTPRRIAVVVGLVVLAVRLRRQLRFVRDAFRYRRRLKLALTLLVFLRQLRKS
jgi:hypothetical protein